jgi:hypothetical protein
VKPASTELYRIAPIARAALAGAAIAGLMAVASGCGDGDGGGGSPNNPELFLGTWMVTEGTASTSCEIRLMQSLVGASVRLIAGTDAPLLAEVRGCQLQLDIAGNTATARPNQTCVTNFDFMNMPYPITLAVSSATFKVEGTTGTLMQGGTAEIPILPAGCPYQATATATKTSAP